MTTRRSFLKASLAAGAFPLFSSVLSPRAYAANGKVRLAVIGIAQQGWYDMRQFDGRFGGCDFAQDASDICEIVALCDTDMESDATTPALKAFPNLPRYRDFRKMFDEMADRIDAVLIAIPDFSHFPAAMHAMRLGKAVYVEKPLAHTFRECALLMAAEKKYGVVTQMGNQGHSSDKYYQFKRYVETGVVRDITHVDVRMNYARRWHKYGGNVFMFPEEEEIPATLDYDTWLGTAQPHAYSAAFMRGEWRCWYDFGCGCLGDWGAHTMDCVHEFLLKGDLPTRVELKKCEGWNPFVYPCAATMAFAFPKNAKHDDFTLTWYDGAHNWPKLPKRFVFDTPDGIPQNSANAASDTKASAAWHYIEDVDTTKMMLCPGKVMYAKDGTVWQSLSHKHPLHLVGDYERKLPDFPHETDSHYRSFIRAVRGETKTTSPFSVAGPLSQLFMLGNIAQRVNRSIDFDPARGEIVGDEYANFFLKGPAPRKGWEGYYTV